MYYVIKSLSMMQYLVREGFNILKVENANDNPKLKVFLFEDNKRLRKAMTTYTNSRK